MIVVGVAFVVWAALVRFFALDPVVAAFVTGVAFILAGLVLGERPFKSN